jgi:uncharacterized protein (DUF983 family)
MTTVWHYRHCGHCGQPHLIITYVLVTWMCQKCAHSNTEGSDG